MKYQIKFPDCPYRGKGNKKCSHKAQPDRCPYNNPEKCPVYNEIVDYTLKQQKTISTPINPPLHTSDKEPEKNKDGDI